MEGPTISGVVVVLIVLGLFPMLYFFNFFIKKVAPDAKPKIQQEKAESRLIADHFTGGGIGILSSLFILNPFLFQYTLPIWLVTLMAAFVLWVYSRSSLIGTFLVTAVFVSLIMIYFNA